MITKFIIIITFIAKYRLNLQKNLQLNQELKVHMYTIANINPDTAQSVFSGICPTDTTKSRAQGSPKYNSQYQSGYN